MKNLNLILAAALFLSSQVSLAKEIKITSSTKEIVPVEQIYVFPDIEWAALERRQAASKSGKKEDLTMVCEDTQNNLGGIGFTGQVGENGRVDSVGCDLDGAFDQRDQDPSFSRTILHFRGPDAGTCTIRVQKKDGSKKLNMIYELSDAC